MELNIDRDGAIERAEREIARIADAAYDGDGNSLYDGIIVTSRDAAAIETMFEDALSALIKRLSDVLVHKPESDAVIPEDEESSVPSTEEETGTGEETDGEDSVKANVRTLSLDLPDFDEIHSGTVAAETGRYISLNIVAAWCQEKYADKAEEYAQRGQAAMDKAVALLKARKKPAITRK